MHMVYEIVTNFVHLEAIYMPNTVLNTSPQFRQTVPISFPRKRKNFHTLQ